MIARTKLSDRILPSYTRGEEMFNMWSHIFGGVIGAVALVTCIVASAMNSDVWAIVSSAVYGSSLILLYTASSVYHGLKPSMAKKVMQVIDHCTIYFLIAGTYTPILLCAIRRTNPALAWTLFGIVWGVSAVATVFTAIDLKKYSKFSMICYIGLGWCIVIASKATIEAVAPVGIALLLLGGIAYTVGAVIYGLGKKHRYMHSVFHIFVVVGSLLHYFCVLMYAI